MQVRKFCLCGVKLDRKDVASEEAARLLVEEFRRAHSGHGHGPASREQYMLAVSRHVARNTRSNQPRAARPLLTAISRAEAGVTRSGRLHHWVDAPGLVYCANCQLVRRDDGREAACAGAALMRPAEFVGYPLPWMRGVQ